MNVDKVISSEFEPIKDAIYYLLLSQRCFVASLQEALLDNNQKHVDEAFENILDINQKIGKIFEIDNLSTVEELKTKVKKDFEEVDVIKKMFAMESPH
jgi:hypothetical protein